MGEIKQKYIAKNKLSDYVNNLLEEQGHNLNMLSLFKPKELVELFDEYIEAEGYYYDEIIGKSGTVHHKKKMCIVSFVGFASYLGVHKGYFQELRRARGRDNFVFALELLETKIEAHNIKCGGKGDSVAKITELTLINKHGYKSKHEQHNHELTARLDISDSELDKIINAQEQKRISADVIDGEYEEK